MSTRAATLERGPFGPRIHEPVQDRVFLRGPKESLSDRLRAAVSKVGAVAHDLSARIAEDKVMVAAGLERARVTISQAVQEKTASAQRTAHAVSTVVTRENMVKVGHMAQQVGAYARDHKVEIAKKVAPAVATAIGVNMGGGAIAAPVALAREVTSGLSNVRHNTREIRGKDIFATSAAIRRGFGREQQPAVQSVDTTSVSEPQRLFQRVSQSRLGRAVSGYLHFEEHVTARSVANNSHIRTIHQITNGKSEVEIRDTVNAIGDVRELFDLRSAAVIARLTADPKERVPINKVHQAVTSRIKLFESEVQVESRRDPHSSAYARFIQVERGFKKREHRAYRSTVRSALGVSLGANLVKTALTTTAFFLGGKVLGLHTQNPLEKSKFWSGLVDHARASLHNLGSDIGQSTASALGIDPSHARYVISPMVDMTHPGVNHDVHSVRGVSEQYASFSKHTAAAGLAMDDQALEGTSHPGIVKAHYSLSQNALDRSIARPSTSASARTEVFMSEIVTEKRQLVGHPVPRAASPITAPITDTKLSIDTDTRIPVFVMKVDDQTSLTERIWDMRDNLAVAKALPFISQAKSVRDAFSARDSGTAMWKLIQANNHLMTSEGYARLQAIVEDPENTHASFGTIWAKYHALYPDDHFGGLDNLGYGGNTGMVTFSDRGVIDDTISTSSVAGVSVARIEDTDTIVTGHRVLGHARLSRSALSYTDNQLADVSRVSNTSSLSGHALGTNGQDTSPPTHSDTVRMTNEEYLAMRQAIASGQPVHSSGGTSIVTPNSGTLTPEQYLAMKNGNASVPPTSPAGMDHPVSGNISADEYRRILAESQSATPNTYSTVDTSTATHGARMDVNEYMRIQRETAARSAEAARASQQMDPQEYMRRVAEIHARNGGGTHVKTTLETPLVSSYDTNTEVGVVGPVDIREGSHHVMTISSDNPRMFHTTVPEGSLPILTTNIPMTQVVDPNTMIDTPAYNSVTYFYDPIEGGLVINGHTGRWQKRIQLLEGFREFVEGYGFNGQKLYGPAQIQRLAQQYVALNSGSVVDFNFDGQTVATHLTSFTVEYRDVSTPFGEPYQLIGSGPDTITLVGCGWSHVEAIGMISALEGKADLSIPSEYLIDLQTLKNPNSSAEQVTGAVKKLLPWLRQLKKDNIFDFDTFHKLIGNLPGESKKFDDMPGLADHGKIRLVFKMVN